MTTVVSLDGLWLIATDEKNVGRDQHWWMKPTPTAKPGRVPGIFQEVFPGYFGVVWYWRDTIILANPNTGGRCLLRFWAVDYLADVWMNGVHVGRHEGGETPFILDCTDAVKPDAPNRIAVRVLNPIDTPIDGYLLRETPHRNKSLPYVVPVSHNYGGIIESTEVLLAPAIRIEDVFVKPDWRTGKVKIAATVRNISTLPAKTMIEFIAAQAHRAESVGTVVLAENLAAGENPISTELTVSDFRLWDLDSPNLYQLRVWLTTDDATSQDEHTVSFGFRDFRVENGFFRLNGKRLFLKCTHTGNHSPVGQIVAPDAAPDLLRRDLLYAKSCGFNTVRFICGVAHPWQLDLCDEIGLMVYEESSASWCLEDSPKMVERFDRATREMILRDRNHPSLTIWCLLNETPNGSMFQHAVQSLPLVRSLDDTRLVILGSGRWDGQHQIGSISNPGSNVWEYVWGPEAPDYIPWPAPDRAPGGDYHLYPHVPMSVGVQRGIREFGRGTPLFGADGGIAVGEPGIAVDMGNKPIFVSEGGYGSTNNVIREWRTYQQYGVGTNPESDDYKWYKSMSERLIADWARYGMDSVYAFPEDFLLASQRLHCRQRTLYFDLLRSNPQICGYSITGMLDHGLTGEGLWTFWREWKPGIADALRDGFAPVRWCTFAEPMHGYMGRPLRFEAILANEDVLAPGEYPVTAKIMGRDGVVWEKRTTVTIGLNGPLAIPVLDETVTLNGPAGEYELALSMEGAAPAGGRLKFWFSDPVEFARLNADVTVWGAGETLKNWLASRGARVKEFGKSATAVREVIIVDDPATSGATDDEWSELMLRVARGSTVLFLNPDAFRKDEDAVARLPLKNKGQLVTIWDWLYHKENVAKSHPVFAGLQGKGIMDLDYYGMVCGPRIFQGQDKPDDLIVAAFAAGFNAPDGTGYLSGVMDAGYRFGQGWFYVNTLRILDNLDTHPAADRILYNFIGFAGQQAGTGKPLESTPFAD